MCDLCSLAQLLVLISSWLNTSAQKEAKEEMRELGWILRLSSPSVYISVRFIGKTGQSKPNNFVQ